METVTLTNPVHKKPYAATSPSRPEVSQSGRTVIITGGNDGIGYAVAYAYGQAGALRVIITGRRAEATKAAAAKLESQLRDSASDSTTKFVGIANDMSKPDDVDRLWADLKAEGINVDVLVLNATRVAAQQKLLDLGTERLWANYDTNVRAQLQMTERFYKQDAESAAGETKERKQKFLVMVSTMAIHNFSITARYPGYGLTKNAGTLLMQLIAQETSPEDMQIVSFHPGAVYTSAAESAGWTKDSIPWIDASLPGQFAVWAASTEAKFLHGRFVWCEWDLEELKNGALRRKIDADDAFLRIGVHGL